MAGTLLSLNVGDIREVDHNGRTVTTGIYKTPTSETLRVAGQNIGPDRQADLSAHGGPHKAVYAYADEDYRWWAEELDEPMEPGFFGENLTTVGVDVGAARIGDRWLIGTAELEVSEPRLACFKLGIRTGIARIQQRFNKGGRPGAYLRIMTEGDITAGDAINVRQTDATTITVADILEIYHSGREAAARLVDVPGLSDEWLAWARHKSES